jgi:universal stress protein E
MKRILVIADPIDEDQSAFAKALEFSKATDSTIHVVGFCYESMGEYEVQDEDYDYSSIKVELVRHSEEWLSEFIADKKADIDITHEVVWEKHIYQWILDHCKVRSYDLIIKTGHRSESAFYTPTDWQLFRYSNVPVYIVAVEKRKSDKVVLVALDFMSKSEEKQALNKELLESGFRLAVQIGGTLHCCHAVHIATLVSDLDLIDVPAHVHKVEKKVLERAEPLLQEYDIGFDNLHIKQGEPWKVLNSLSSTLNAECIIVGSMGRTGIAGKLIGNTAEKIIRKAKRDLLVISPQPT